ncbi:MAG TPA: hypothetical protein VHM31_08165 [Polyangia bacterium]|nr:hypothetical protein [Polyangia bacterium]
MNLRRHLGAVAVAIAVASLAATARATPRPLPFTYIYETLPAGDAEIELYTDLTPLRLVDPSANPGTYLATQYQLEVEYGLTDRLELGLYLTLAPMDPGWSFAPAMPEGNGVKQRLRYRFADAGRWPVDLAVYGEVTENQREIELEAKVILQRRIGPVRLAANAWAEHELYYSGRREWVLNPTAGAVLEKWPALQPGVEYWMRGELSGSGSWVLRPQHYLGPTVLLQWGKIWWSNGLYFLLNGLHSPPVGSGDPFGAIWARTIIGISF